MTGKLRGTHYILNRRVLELGSFSANMQADIWYEVVRLVEGKILFLSEHLDRLEKSFPKGSMEMPPREELIAHLRLLVENNSIESGNIRLCLHAVKGGRPDIMCYFVPHFYPGPEQYLQGVVLASFRHQRPSPGVKKWDQDFRSRVREFIREKDIYEALLVNDLGYIREGSRSNVFFLDNEGCVLTPPPEQVLPGITRKYVLSICHDLSIPFREEPLKLDEAGKYRAVFISGTSPGVLPVRKLDRLIFNPADVTVRKIMHKYEEIFREKLETIG